MSDSKLSTQEVFNNKKLFSQKIHTQVLQVIEEISTYINKFEISNDADKKLFMNAVNYYYLDLTEVIFHLRQVVIKIGSDDPNISNLHNVITELNKLVFPVQECLNLEIEKLKIQLKCNVSALGFQVEELMKIVKLDNLHEYKQKVLDCQLDLLLSAEDLKLHIQHSNVNPIELERMLHEVMRKIKSNIIKMKTDHELLDEDFSHYTCHTIQHIQTILDYFRKLNHTEKFENDVRNVFNAVEVFAIAFITDILEAVRRDNPMKNMLDVIDNCDKNVSKASLELQKGFEKVKTSNIGEKDKDTLKELITHIFICGINGMSALNHCIESLS